MSHTTASGSTSDATATGTVVKVQDYHPACKGVHQSRLDAVLRRSERFVGIAAPPPSSESTEELAAYREVARDAELAVFEHLLERPSYVTQESVMGSSTSFVGSEGLEELVREAMPDYYLSPSARDDAVGMTHFEIFG